MKTPPSFPGLPALLALPFALIGLCFSGYHSASAQDKPEKSTAEGEGPAAAAAAAAQQPTLIKPEELKWNQDLKWISFIVDDGRVQSQRDYFGAVTQADFQTLLSGSPTAMLKVQQVFYYNGPSRQFSRFDASGILGNTGYFKPSSIMRVVELNQKFVEGLAVRGFVNVAGE